jgi:K+-transporting ATPase ATPase A chain
MTLIGVLQLLVYLVVLLALVRPLGSYIARVYGGDHCGLDRVLGPVEQGIYKVCGIRPDREMTWKEYAVALLLFNGLGFLGLYGFLRLQGFLPLNPQGMPAVPPDLAFNTAVSFISNTNWQAYGGETTLSYFTQMVGLTVQNFLSAATGMAVLVALIRGLRRRETDKIGNFWVDLVRSTLYILLPLSLILAVVLVSQGVVQTFRPYPKVALLQPLLMEKAGNPAPPGAALQTAKEPLQEQTIAVGPVASQVAIKQLGTNGGGFFNVNSAHPFENPTPLSNFLELLAILLIPAALCYTFGQMVGDTRQGWALLAAMVIIFLGLLFVCVHAEQAGNPRLTALGVDQLAQPGERSGFIAQEPTSFHQPDLQHHRIQAGGNMEGKEVRFGIVGSALWATATTAASNGSVNAMHDSFTPLGGLAPMVLMQLGEVVFGGVGSGLYGMIVFAIVAVFIAGLMVGRTPEYLGKKIEAYEMKMASLIILLPLFCVLGSTAVAVITKAGQAGASNPGAHGFSEILYAFSSMGNNNGSAFAGLNANAPFYNLLGGVTMLVARYWLILPTLAIAGSLAAKKTVPVGLGTLPTHTPLFVVLLCAVVLVVGALTFMPALALGPIVEHLLMVGH